jgi:hypothetical protein
VLEAVRIQRASGTRSPAFVSVRYVILASRDAKRLDKQRTRIIPSDATREERYRGIDVRSFICERISIEYLMK